MAVIIVCCERQPFSRETVRRRFPVNWDFN